MEDLLTKAFGRAFDEDEVEEAIINCRKELNNENI